jgi:catechol 2,3-dioxygenase-like lactoylglutathione lyase family enzyme
VHHLTLTVRDVEKSACWYEELLGTSTRIMREGPGWHRIRMAWPSGLVIGVTAFDDGFTEGFDHRRVGMDHVGLACSSEDEVRSWAARMDELGLVHGPVEDVPYGWAVTARDPDGIPVEFFCAK